MKYQSEIIAEIVDKRGHEKSSVHYESECIQTWIDENKGSYPKLCDYQSEWLNYINENHIGVFPYETLTDVTEATVNNVVPYSYKSAILKGSTKYRDIDTGEVLDAFEDGRNLELVSVRMPVLTTTGKNLFDKTKLSGGEFATFNGKSVYSYIDGGINFKYNSKFKENTQYTFTGKIYRDDENNSLKVNFNFYYTDGTRTVNNVDQGSLFTLTSAKDKTIDYISGSYNFNRSAYLDLEVAQLEESSVATSYEPFKTNILTANEEVELRGIGKVKDELNLLTGELTERIGNLQPIQLTFNSPLSINTNTVAYSFEVIPDIKPNQKNTILSNALPQNNATTILSENEGFYTDSKSTLVLVINKSRLTTLDKNGLLKWLTDTSCEIIYIKSAESIKTVDLSVTDQGGNQMTKIKPIEGTMHIKTDGIPIKPTFTGEIPVEAITQNLASFTGE